MRTLVFLGFSISLLGNLARAENLDSILAAHETAVSSVQFLQCKYTKTNEFPLPGRPKTLSGEIKRSPNLILVTAKGIGYQSVFFARSGRFQNLTYCKNPHTGKMESHSIITATKRIGIDVDPLRDIMVFFDLESMLSGRGGLREYVKLCCKNEAIDRGNEVFIPYATTFGGIRLSRRYNCFAIESVASGPLNGVQNVTTMSAGEFLKIADGISLPTLGSLVVESNGTTVMSHKTKLADINIRPFADQDINMQYPERTRVINQIDGTEYTVDKAGAIQGEVAPFVPLIAGSGGNSSDSRLPSTSEESRFIWWLLPACCTAISLIAAIVFYFRGRRTLN